MSLALHALCHTVHDAGEAQTSSDIAEHAGTNPVVDRRVLGKLREAGLVATNSSEDPEACSFERALGERISDIMEEVETDLVARLSTMTTADIQKSARV